MDTPIVKVNCTICLKEKPFIEFNKDKNKKLGIETRCRDCAKKSGIEYRKKRKDAGKKYTPRDPERTRRLADDWRKENPARVKATSKRCILKNKYGLTIHEFSKMKKEQNFMCAICERNEAIFKKGLCIDHDHKTGKVRALLCGECNIALGKFQDDPDIILKAARYLKSHTT